MLLYTTLRVRCSPQQMRMHPSCIQAVCTLRLCHMQSVVKLHPMMTGKTMSNVAIVSNGAVLLYRTTVLSVCLSVCLSVYLSIYLHVSIYIYMYIYLYMYVTLLLSI